MVSHQFVQNLYKKLNEPTIFLLFKKNSIHYGSMLQAIYNFLTNYEFGSPFWAQHKRKKLKSLQV